MTEESALLERIAAQLAEILDLTEQMRADVREMHASLDRIEGHLRRIDALLQQALSRSSGEREAR